MSSGAYEERLQARRDSLARLEAIQAKLKEDTERLEAEKELSRSRLTDQERRLQILQENTAALAQNVRQLSQNLSSDDARLNAVRAQVADLDRQIRNTEAATKAGQIKQQQLQQRSAALEEEYRRLMDLYIALGQ